MSISIHVNKHTFALTVFVSVSEVLLYQRVESFPGRCKLGETVLRQTDVAEWIVLFGRESVPSLFVLSIFE